MKIIFDKKDTIIAVNLFFIADHDINMTNEYSITEM